MGQVIYFCAAYGGLIQAVRQRIEPRWQALVLRQLSLAHVIILSENGYISLHAYKQWYEDLRRDGAAVKDPYRFFYPGGGTWPLDLNQLPDDQREIAFWIIMQLFAEDHIWLHRQRDQDAELFRRR